MTGTPAQRRPRERTLFFVAAAVFAAAVLWLLASLVTGATLVDSRRSAGAALIAVVACAVAVLAAWRSELGRLRAESEERERLTAELSERDGIARWSRPPSSRRCGAGRRRSDRAPSSR